MLYQSHTVAKILLSAPHREHCQSEKTKGFRARRATRTEKFLPLQEFQKPRPANRHDLGLQAGGRMRARAALYEHQEFIHDTERGGEIVPPVQDIAITSTG